MSEFMKKTNLFEDFISILFKTYFFVNVFLCCIKYLQNITKFGYFYRFRILFVWFESLESRKLNFLFPFI